MFKTGHEVDLIVEIDGKLHPIECKLNEAPSHRGTFGMTKLRTFYGEDAVTQATIVSPSLATYSVGDTTVRPGWTSWAV